MKKKKVYQQPLVTQQVFSLLERDLLGGSIGRSLGEVEAAGQQREERNFASYNTDVYWEE